MLAYVKFEERERALARKIARRRAFLDMAGIAAAALLLTGLVYLAALAFPGTDGF